MNDFQIINLKEYRQSVFQAIKELEIFFDLCIKAKVKAIKVIHGYGSLGRGGAICKAVLNYARQLSQNNIIKFYLTGHQWNLSNKKALEVIYASKDCYNDDDLNKSNPGITILVLK